MVNSNTVAHSGSPRSTCSHDSNDESNEELASGGSYSDQEGISAEFSTGVSLAPSGDIFYIEDPTAPPLSRGTSAASWSDQRRAGGGGGVYLPSPGTSDSGRSRWLGEKAPSRLAGPSTRMCKHGCIQPCVDQPRGQSTSRYCTPVIKLHRPIMSRHNKDTFRVQATLTPRNAGVAVIGGCCGICRAPSSFPFLAHLSPCCAYPEELEEARRESSYLVIRDNGVEFNNPSVAMGSRPTGDIEKDAPGTATFYQAKYGKHASSVCIKGGTYTGICGCTFHVRDDARVLYFDDPVLADITTMSTSSSLWDTLWWLLCGSRGQTVRVQSRICCGLCVRSRGACALPCVPTCCLCAFPGSALSYDMPAKDAADAAAKITKARDDALARMRLIDDANAAVRIEHL